MRGATRPSGRDRIIAAAGKRGDGRVSVWRKAPPGGRAIPVRADPRLSVVPL
jgi:hypothetical protein